MISFPDGDDPKCTLELLKRDKLKIGYLLSVGKNVGACMIEKGLTVAHGSSAEGMFVMAYILDVK